MFGKAFAVGAVALASIALAAGPSNAAGEIGNVHLVKLWAYGTPVGGSQQPLYRADELFPDELVETIENGALHIRFLDNSKLRLGSASTVTLDSFVYDPSTNAGELVADLGEGVFRFITGKLNSEGIEIRTPVAVIGVRGTDFIASITSLSTIIAVLSGIVTVTPRVVGATTTTVTAGQGVTVDAAGTVRAGTAGPVDDNGLKDGAGIGSPDSAGVGGGRDKENDSSPNEPSPPSP